MQRQGVIRYNLRPVAKPEPRILIEDNVRPVPYIRRGGDIGQFAELTLRRSMPEAIVEISSLHQADRAFIFLPVLDYQRLAMPEDGGRIGLLEPDDIVALREGRAALLLDLSNEGPAYEPVIFDALHGNLDRLGVPRERVIFVSQNRLLRFQYEKRNPPGLRFWNLEYFVSLLGMWLDEHMSPKTFAHQAFEPKDYLPMAYSSQAPGFLCQNAAVRWHRVLIYRWLQVNGMLDQGLVSFHGIDPENSKAHEFDMAAPPPGTVERFPELLTGIDEWMPRSARRIDGGGWGNDLVVSLDLDSYARTDFTIVTETDFFVRDIARVTEKAVKAAAAGNPFVLIGAPHSVSRLVELGFCDFDGLIDHGYDLIGDPLDRFVALFETISASWELCQRDPYRWRQMASEVARYNFAFARNGLHQRIKDVIEKPFVKRMELFHEVGIISA